jgi:FKBP-type peptidyl-prolyl cis-trans isomerase
MSLPVPRCPTRLTAATGLALFLAGALPAAAQQGAAASGDAAPAAKAPPESAAATKSADSYSLGLIFGTQLHEMGVTPADVSSERFQAGIHDALSGKAAMSPKDQQNAQALVRRVHDRALESNHATAAAFLAANGKKPGIVTTQSGLQYKVLKEGSGDAPKASDTVEVNYRGTLLDGSEFDSSYKGGEPAKFAVGRVIPGWTEALQLMKPGGKYQLWIPPGLAYDAQPPPRSGIPPGSLLLFEVELLKVLPPAAATPSPPAPGTPAPKQP